MDADGHGALSSAAGAYAVGAVLEGESDQSAKSVRSQLA